LEYFSYENNSVFKKGKEMEKNPNIIINIVPI